MNKDNNYRKLTAGPLDATPPNRKRVTFSAAWLGVDLGRVIDIDTATGAWLVCNDDGSKSTVGLDGKVFKHETPDALIDAIENEIKAKECKGGRDRRG